MAPRLLQAASLLCVWCSAQAAAYLGCFFRHPATAWTAPLAVHSGSECASTCRSRHHALYGLARTGRLTCYCTSIVPRARLVSAHCVSQRPGTVHVFYAAEGMPQNWGCRAERVPLLPNNTIIAYNPHRVEFGPQGFSVRLNMTGDGAGTRLAVQGAHTYGLYQVSALVDGSAGVVSAFYLRSDLAQETRDFSEIDYEFLNARPSVPHGLWLNSFARGMSSGEQLVTPEQYRPVAGLAKGDHSGNTWLTYGINWLPNQVTWSLNGAPLSTRRRGDVHAWRDMLGVARSRVFRPPDKPSYVTLSIWTATGSGLGFGGSIPPKLRSRMFSSAFRHHARVVCAKSLAPLPPPPGIISRYGN